MDVVGRRRLRLDLLAQLSHEDAQGGKVAALRAAPDLAQDVAVCEHAPHVSREEAEQAVLDGREMQLVPCESHHARGIVDHQVAVLEGRLSGLVRRGHVGEVAFGGAQACQQLAHREGLGEVVVGAGIERPDLVGVPRACRHHDDGDARPRPDLADDVDPIHVGEAEVEQDHVGWVRDDGGDGRVAPGRRAVLIVVQLESRGDEASDGRIVLHYEHARLAPTHLWAPPRWEG